MSDDLSRSAALKEVRAAQKQFEREREDSRQARRKAFAKAQKAGLSLREIAEEAGLHHSSVAEIIEGK
jgi:lambda repressor-like predicted transcriptional regulator